jgi:cobalamin biosynthesis Mg chelatase CobN
MGTTSMENPGSTTTENTSTSELPSLPQAESTTGTAPSIENPVPQSTSGTAAQSGLGASGTPAIKSLTPQDNVTTQPQNNENAEEKQKNSEDSGMLTVMLIIGLAVVMGVLIIILVFTFVVTPQEGTFFYSLRETFASIF